MLVISGIKALIGLILAYIMFKIVMVSDLEGVIIIIIGSVFLWFYLFVTDLVEDWMIERFNPEG